MNKNIVRRITKNAIMLALLCTIGMFSLPLGDNIKVSLQLLMVFIIALTAETVIDSLIVTHPHGDHFGGIISGALDDLSVSMIVDYGYTYSTSETGTIENSSYVSAYTTWRDNRVKGGTTYYSVLEALKSIPTVNISKEDDCYLKWLKNDYYVAKGETFPNSKVPTDNPNTTSVSMCSTKIGTSSYVEISIPRLVK